MKYLAILLLVSNGVASAQTCDPGSWLPMTLRIGGVGPDANGQLPVQVGATLPFSFGLNTSRSFLLVAGPTLACGGLQVPWGGTLDVASPIAIIDGISGSVGPMDPLGVTPLTATLNFPTGLAGTAGPAYQAIWTDASHPPFFLRNTSAAQPVFSNGGTITFAPGSYLDDGFITLNSPVPVTLYGQAYTTLYLGSNGQITFGGGSSAFGATMPAFFAGMGAFAGGPGVAAVWGDFARLGHGGDITVVLDTANQTVQVQHNNQEFWASGASAGSWSVTFGGIGPGSVVLDTSAAITAGLGLDWITVMGVTNGNAALGPQTTLDLATSLPYVSAVSNDSVGGSYMQPGGPIAPPPGAFPALPAAPVTFIDGNVGAWSIF